MKTKVLFIFFMASCLNSIAQNVSIPDANFKAALVANGNINTNNDAEIQVSEASAYTGGINAANLGIQDLTGIETFTEIVALQAFGNPSLTSIDVSQNIRLTQLLIEQTGVSGILDLSMLTVLVDFKAHTTAITAINMANGNNNNVTRFNVVNSSVDCVQIDADFTPNSNWSISSSGNYNTDCPTILSVNDFKFNTVSVYPNPASDIINIKMKHDIKNVEVYNVSGQKVMTTTNNMKSINVRDFANGLYLIKVETIEGVITIKRFIKQ